MRVLILDAYYKPELVSWTHLESDIIDAVVDAGSEVEVVCPIPSRGVTPEVRQKYRNTREELDGSVKVHRFWSPVEPRNPVMRAARYFWCNLQEHRLGERFRGVDTVFAVSTPPTQGLLAGMVAHSLGARFVYSLQDVFPDSLVSTGLAKQDRVLWRIGRAIEKKTYALADEIIVISNQMRDNLTDKGVEKEKLHVISNWIDLDKVNPVSRCDNRLFDELNIDRGRFTVVYAGNFGAAQSVETIVEAARLLSDRTEIQFVLFGAGARFETTVKDAAQLNNMAVYPLQPQERVAEVYSLGDIGLITCKRGISEIALPSKLWSMLACNSRVVAAYEQDSAVADILRDSQAGICVAPENPMELAAAIETEFTSWVQLGEDVHQTSGGREYVSEHASRPACAGAYAKLIVGGTGQ